MTDKRLQWRTLFSYSATAIPLAILGLPLYIYLPTFYAQNVGMSVTLVGSILFLARLTDVITDPLIGFYSDRFQSKFGRRKPFMLIGTLILIVSFYALIHPPVHSQEVWLLFFSILIYFGWSLVSIPYLAWSAEISSDYHEKTRLSAGRELFTIFGALTALVIPYLYNVSASPSESLRLLYMFFLVIVIFMLPLTLFGIKESLKNTTKHYTFKQIITLWDRVPSLYRLQSAFTLNSLANALPATLFIFYVQLVLQEEDKTGPLLLLYFASGIMGLPFWTWLSKKTGKHKSWLYSMILASLAFSFVPLIDAGDLSAFLLITMVSGLSLGADMALPSSMQADIVQKLQHTQTAYAGLLFGIWAMLTKFALALAVGIGFVILGIVGFEPQAPTPLALTTLSLLYGALPVFFKIVAFWLMKDYRETF